MLFDLRGRGRRRTVQVIYIFLALLMGGGLVFLGVGGNVDGGLLDAFKGGGGSDNSAIEKQVETAEKRVERNPQDAAGWADLATARYQLAGVSEGFQSGAADPTQQFAGKSRSVLEDAAAAWTKHLALVGDDDQKANSGAAAIMRNALVALGQPDKAVRAQEIVIANNPKAGVGDFSQLALLAWTAGQTRKGDLAQQKAVELAPKGQKKAVRAQLQQQKAQLEQQAPGGAGQAGGATPPPTGP